jgi:dephospho-CoA kinase
VPVIGVTGSLGAGKSTVARVFARHGATLVDADAIGHEMLLRGGPCFDALVERFGRDIVGPDGEIVRRALGMQAFADTDARRSLNAIVHPPLVARLVTDAQEADRPGHAVVVDAALLLEWGSPVPLARVVVVSAPEEVRVRRFAERGGLSIEEARRRLVAQMPESEKILRADIVIANDGTVADLEERAERVWRQLSRELSLEDDHIDGHRSAEPSRRV